MVFKIGGFAASQEEKLSDTAVETVVMQTEPRKSLVQVRFLGRGMDLAYYNDRFDLKLGDRVYVDGKLEGSLGRVVEISYNFKIKIADYQKVIARVDTEIHGDFFMAGSHFVTFDPTALPVPKALLWFRAPEKEGDEYVSANDDSTFPQEDPAQMGVSGAIAERGRKCYMENRVRYLCVDHGRGVAVVEGSENYVVEFLLREGQISHLICQCPCAYPCKHEFAAMLQLRETLAQIAGHYAEEYAQSGYFAAVHKATLFAFAVEGREQGKIVL